MREVERLRELVDLGPADARHAPLAEAHGASRQDAETLDPAVLLRLLERELKPEANAEHRLALRDARAQDVVEPAGAQAAHRSRGRTDAGKDGQVRGPGVAADFGAEPLERERDGAHVPGSVLADRDSHSVPFVEGIPADSRRTAARSARPTALNAASATWCSSRPVASTLIAARADCARLASMCSASPGSRSSWISAAGRPPRSTAARASASSIGTTASP